MDSLIETEVLVIGCGIAGATTALLLANQGVDVTLVTHAAALQDRNNTYLAQGGIVYQGVADSPQQFEDDILRAGAQMCHPRAIQILAEEGPSAVREILMDELRVSFDKTRHGNLSLVREGSHSVARILHGQDATGRVIFKAYQEVLLKHPHIQLLTGYTVIDLMSPSHHSKNIQERYRTQSCVGAYVLDQNKDRVVTCLAKKIVLATGGLGQIFLRTTNPVGARGDGLAMAYRMGGRIMNNEFIQFHPTTFFKKGAPSFLISEAVRGAGAKLVDADGVPFMKKYDPTWQDLASRDVVSRSIYQEMLMQDLSHVYLDLRSYLSANEISEKFPNMVRACLEQGVDPACDWIPVVPAAHYACGGVWVDDWGKTSIEHLYAVGEVSCTGVHGANRLASTSLLEGLVWGRRAAQHIAEHLKVTQKPQAADYPAWQNTGERHADPVLVKQDFDLIRNIMWNYVGLIRTTDRLERAYRELKYLEFEIERFYQTMRLNDDLIGLRNAIGVALIVATAARRNKTSLGCHFRIS